MGLLIDGVWHDQWYDTEETKGKFEREAAKFRNWVTVDGSAGPTGEGGFKAEPGRYHLYVSYACPWAHRTIIFRKLKKLEDIISLNVVNPHMLENGWSFAPYPGSTPDEVNHCEYLYQVYLKANPQYSGRVTVPILWDKRTNTIVSNESADIIRMLNNVFNQWAHDSVDFYPEVLQSDIDVVNAYVYDKINNGVYKAGFATKQEVYEKAVKELFSALNSLDNILFRHMYLVDNYLTEADWRLFTTLIRFDAVYFSHFKCNLQQLHDYHSLHQYVKRLYDYQDVATTVNFDHIKQHYYVSQKTINPNGIVPLGPLEYF
jgi:putative glutathione S-transferase